MSLPLLSTRLIIPAVNSKYLQRPRLQQVLDEGFRQKAVLMLVCGPAGYGKSTVVSGWLQNSNEITLDQAAWLTLDSTEEDLIRFLTYWVASIQTFQPGFGTGLVELLHSHKPPAITLLATLFINEFSRIPNRFCLVLDDFHHVSAKPILDFVSFLVDHQPSQMCLVIITRADPALPLARLRGRGQLVEIRQQELSFTSSEMESFVSQWSDLKLTSQQLAVLGSKTEGWITGLQLAAISLHLTADKTGFFSAFSGGQKFIADYLTDEVLSRMEPSIQDFLLQTSILDQLSAPLCDAVTGTNGTQSVLEKLANANLFLISLDGQSTWYRYHSLFADLLRKRLVDRYKGNIQDFHIRASQWFNQNGMTSQAIEHAIVGGDFSQAAQLIDPIAESQLMQGQSATLLSWIKRLPEQTLNQYPHLSLLRCFILVMNTQSLEEVERICDALAASNLSNEMTGQLATVRAMVAVLQGRTQSAMQQADQALKHLPVQQSFFRSLAADSLGMAHTLAGNLSAAIHDFEQVYEISQHSNNIMMALAALSNLAGMYYAQGKLHRSVHICQQVIDLATQRIGRQTPMLGKTLFTLGEILCEMGQTEQGYAYLLESASMMEMFSDLGLALTWVAIARVKMDQSDWSTAQTYLDQAREKAKSSPSILMTERLIDIMQARFWLMNNVLDAVEQWAQERKLLDQPLDRMVQTANQNLAVNEIFFVETFTLIRLLLAKGQLDLALSMLEILEVPVKEKGLFRRIIEINILKSLVFLRQGERTHALAAIEIALGLAQPEGYQRIFLNEGEQLIRLLYLAIEHNVHPEYCGNLIANSPEFRRDLKNRQIPAASDLIEALSDREIDVLRLLSEGLSNSEIARQLYITISTVKGHTSNIYGKLNAKNRTQAVAHARMLGLLPEVTLKIL